MKIALIYPPSADPTAPYISVPLLTGYLRSKGLAVLPVDANIEAWDRFLRKESLSVVRDRLERRWKRQKKKKSLSHTDQLAWIHLDRARAGAEATCGSIDDAVAVMRDGSGRRFYDPAQYEDALMTIENALELISAAWTPLALDFSSYRTPFSLLDLNEIAADAEPERNPFHEYFRDLAERLAGQAPDVIGISMVFTNQLQPAYSLAMQLRRAIPAAHITAGGPAITQILLRLPETQRDSALGPFHSAIVCEGEKALLDLASDVDRGDPPAGVIRGETGADPGTIPAPDFEGLPLNKYLSPEPVLPYDPTRGCYWGKCAFCHYGLARTGTAPYRERPARQVLEHLRHLSEKHHCRVFYFSQDTIHPNSALRLAGLFSEAKAPWKWASDIRPEPLLTADSCRALAEGGALAFSLGIESAAERVLKLINKGVRPRDIAAVVEHLADAGIAVEAMTFTGFPTETGAEALATIRFLEALRDKLSLFICGEFSLGSGSLVAQQPDRFGIDELWTVGGDTFIRTLFYTESGPALSSGEVEAIDRAITRLSGAFRLHRYPWAGSLSTAHTLLWYNRFGPAVFRDLARDLPARRNRKPRDRHGLLNLSIQAHENEAAIWQILIHEKRAVSRRAYQAMANHYPKVKGRP
jgi:hypothetical protein